MEKMKLLRVISFRVIGVSTVLLAGCSIFANKSVTETPESTEQFAYYTCGGCHGPQDVRVEFMTPNIIGQKKGYLAIKLREFRDMKRIHPSMNGVVSKLTDQDINNLANYYSNYQRK